MNESEMKEGGEISVACDPEELKAIQEQILDHISNYSGELFFKSQQRDEPPLSSSDKREIAARILESSPSNFLARFGKALDQNHLNYFNQHKDEYEVKFYLQLLKREKNPKMMKNQRFLAMNQLIDEGKYFSMNEMRRRDPVNFYHMVEKYMSSDEKRELEEQEPNKICNLSTIFMAHIDGNDSVSSKRKLDQITDETVWDEYKSAMEEEEEEDEDDGIVDQMEKKLFREEFISSKVENK